MHAPPGDSNVEPKHRPGAIASLADIEAIESQPWSEWASARSTYDLLRQAAAKSPDAPALLYTESADSFDSLRTWSFGQLVREVRQAAQLLRSLGVARGSPVALLSPHTPSAQVALWGAELAGCAFPVNFLLNAEHIAQLLRAAGARVVVALDESPGLPVARSARRAAELAGCVEHIVWIDPSESSPAADSFQTRLRAQPDAWPEEESPGPDDLAALFHTGGTTGLPKLLRHTHANQIHTSRAATAFYDFGAGDRMLNGFPLFHVAGAFVYGLSCLAAGGAVFIPTLTGFRNAEFVRRAWSWFDHCELTHLGCVPTTLAALLTSQRRPREAARLRLALTGGSPLPPELAARFERDTGIPVRSILGMTECAGIVSIEPAVAPRVPNSVGLRLPYTEVAAIPLDDATAPRIARRLPPGESGVLALRGPHVSPGYRDPSRNAGTFTEDGWLLSGDLGHVDAEGRVFITGRAKDLIIRSSHNIDPGLIEDAFCAHPAVLACAAVGEPDAYAGELPVAFVSLKPGARLAGEDLLRAVAPSIAEPPAVPRRVVVLDEMPMTPVGKIFKPALRAQAAERKLRELLAAAAPGLDLAIDAQDRGGRVTAQVRLPAGCPPGLAERLRPAVAELPIAVEFE